MAPRRKPNWKDPDGIVHALQGRRGQRFTACGMSPWAEILEKRSTRDMVTCLECVAWRPMSITYSW